MFKTVLFDLDGTLLNTIDDLADSANRVCKAHGWPEHDTAQYKYFVGNGIPKLVERFSPEDQRDPETLQKTQMCIRDRDQREAGHQLRPVQLLRRRGR